MGMQKIPQAVAMVLLTGALVASGASQSTKQDAAATGQDAAPTGEPRAGASAGGSMHVVAYTQIKSLLEEFLSRVDDPAMHERFWADDLIYVGANGAVKTKQEIVSAVRAEAMKVKPATATFGSAEGKGKSTVSSASDSAGDTPETYGAEDVQVRQYGDVAVLNFRLVRHVGKETSYYRNSGTFVKNNGQWQAVSWQATKIEKPEAASTSEKKPVRKE